MNAVCHRCVQRALGPHDAGTLEHARRIEDDHGDALFHGKAGTHGRRKCDGPAEQSHEFPARSGAPIEERGALVALAIGLRRVCDEPLAGNQREVAVDGHTEASDVTPTFVRRPDQGGMFDDERTAVGETGKRERAEQEKPGHVEPPDAGTVLASGRAP